MEKHTKVATRKATASATMMPSIKDVQDVSFVSRARGWPFVAHALPCLYARAACGRHEDCKADEFCSKGFTNAPRCRPRSWCASWEQDPIDGQCPPGACAVCIHTSYTACQVTESLSYAVVCGSHTDCVAASYCANWTYARGRTALVCRRRNECFDDNDAIDGRCPPGP